MRHALGKSLPVLTAALMVVAVGCGGSDHGHDQDGDATHSHDAEHEAIAVAQLAPTEGNDVSGKITFTRKADGIHVAAELTGLSEGPHGFHIHEKGDCSAPDGTSAGGHFNPFGHMHGAPGAAADKRHVGDLGNVRAGADGTATQHRLDTVLSFEGDASILGRSVIVHAGEDDLASQPTGAAGGRVACGVIELVEGEM